MAMILQIKTLRCQGWLIACCLLASVPLQAEESIATLPDVFHPITWDTRAETVVGLFAASEIHEVTTGEYPYLKDDDLIEVQAIFITQKQRDTFGDALMIIEHIKDKITGVHIFTSDTREGCFYVEAELPADCRGHYTRELETILFALKEKLEKTFGPATAPEVVSDYASEHQQYAYSWNPDGYTLYLNLMTDEEDYWAVELYAVRDAFYCRKPRELGCNK